MTIRNLLNFNLNYLLFLNSLLTTKSVTKAAQECFVSQPAMSYALNKLRTSLKDPILIKNSNHTELTPYAISIKNDVATIISNISTLTTQNTVVDPTKPYDIKIACLDYIEAYISVGITRIVKKHPNITITFERLNSKSYEDSLLKGEFLIAAAYFPDIPTQLDYIVLDHDEFVCISRKNHPLITTSLDLPTFISLNHIMVTETVGSYPFVNESLAQKGVCRKIGLHTPHFLTAPSLVEKTDLVITLPKKLVETYFSHLSLDIWPLPIPIKCPEIKCIWSPIWNQHSVHKWFIDQLKTQQESNALCVFSSNS